MKTRHPVWAGLLTVPLLLLPVQAPAIAAGSPPVKDLALRGTQAPGEVVVSWIVPDRAAYAGARVLVMPGAQAPSGPDDAGAVSVADVPATDLSVTWTAPTSAAEYTVAVFGRDASGAYGEPALSRLWVPGPVRHFVVGSYRGVWATGAWTLPPGASGAILAYARSGAPASLSAAETYSTPGVYEGTVDTPGGFGVFSTNQFAAFARAVDTGVLGPQTLVVGETPPPFPATRLSDVGADARRIYLQWNNGYQEPGQALHGSGGTNTWLVHWSVGASSPAVGGTAGSVEIPISTDWRTSTVITGLARNTTYTFAVRGRDAEGNLSAWSEPLTTATRRPGVTLVSDDRRDRHWRRSRVPGTHDASAGSAAVARDGTVFVGAYAADRDEALVARRWPGGDWQARVAVNGGYRHLALDNRRGRLVAASFECIHSKRFGRPWRTRWCADARVNDGVSSLAVDRDGFVHALVDTLAGISYVTNVDGRWRVHALPDVGPAYLPILRYDRATDMVLLLFEDASANKLRVATKRPGNDRFGPLRSWYSTGSSERLFQVSSVAARAGRLVVAVTTRDPQGRVWGSPMLLSGRVGGRSASVQAIRGSVNQSVAPVVGLGRGRRIHVAWVRATDLPGHPAQGVWSSAGRWSSDRGRWVLSRPERRSTSAYDRVLDVDVGTRGRAYLLVGTVLHEWERLRPG